MLTRRESSVPPVPAGRAAGAGFALAPQALGTIPRPRMARGAFAKTRGLSGEISPTTKTLGHPRAAVFTAARSMDPFQNNRRGVSPRAGHCAGTRTTAAIWLLRPPISGWPLWKIPGAQARAGARDDGPTWGTVAPGGNRLSRATLRRAADCQAGLALKTGAGGPDPPQGLTRA